MGFGPPRRVHQLPPRDLGALPGYRSAVVHQVLSRKYRPQRFGDLVGQDHVARILRNALRSDRVGHAYLFVGPRGVGKTSSARIFARALNCSGRTLTPDDIEPCGTCPSCVDVAAGSDLDVVEMDAASNNAVDDVRTLREQVGYATIRSDFRIWIVDEVHMLSMAAFTAFLKTLEEPPERVKFVFCTTEEHKLPDTFRSRCQRVEFRPVSDGDMSQRLLDLAQREDVTLDTEVAEAIASSALGGLRDAESILEQLLASCPEGRVQMEDFDTLVGRAPATALEGLHTAVAAQDAAAALAAADTCLATGCKPGVLFDQWLDRLRQDLVSAAAGEGTGSVPRLARAIDVLLAKRAHLRAGADGVLITQVAAVELARLPDARDLDQLIGALRDAPLATPATPASGAARPAARRATRQAQSSASARAPEDGDSQPRPSTQPAAPAPTEAPRASPGTGDGGATAVEAKPRKKKRVKPPDPAPSGKSPQKAPSAKAPRKSPQKAPSAKAPRKSPQKTPAPAGPGAGVDPDKTALTLESVTADWPRFVRALGRRDGRLGALVERLECIGVDPDNIVLRMPQEISGARSTFSRREIQIAFGQVARDVFGVARRPLLRERDAGGAPAADGPDLRGHPLVDLVAEVTRGRLLNVERRASARPQEQSGDKPEAGSASG